MFGDLAKCESRPGRCVGTENGIIMDGHLELAEAGVPSAGMGNSLHATATRRRNVQPTNCPELAGKAAVYHGTPISVPSPSELIGVRRFGASSGVAGPRPVVRLRSPLGGICREPAGRSGECQRPEAQEAPGPEYTPWRCSAHLPPKWTGGCRTSDDLRSRSRATCRRVAALRDASWTQHCAGRLA